MIPVRVGTAVAVATAVLALGAAAHLVLRWPLDGPDVATLTVGPGEETAVPRPLSPDSLAVAAARRDPFRVARIAAPERFGVATPGDPDAVPRPPRPALVLVGIVGGPEPAALVDGLPGVEGTRALIEGERVGDLLVRRITDGHVVISAPDTVWTLEVRRVFP